MFKRSIGFITILILLVLIAIPGCSETKKTEEVKAPVPELPTIQWSLAHQVQAGHSWDLTMQELAKRVEQKTNGKFKIKVFPARQLGSEPGLMEQVRSGAVPMAQLTIPMIANISPSLAGLQLPFLFDNYDILKKTLKGETVKKMLGTLDSYGFKGLVLYDCGYRYPLTSKRHIKTPADFKGLKWRVIQSPISIDSWNAIGVNATPLAYGEMYSGLQLGVIDAIDIGPRAGLDEKFFEVAKYYSKIPVYSFPMIMVVNKKQFEELPAEYRKILEDTAWELVDYNFDIFQKQDVEAMPKVTGELKVMYDESVKDLTPFRALVESVYKKYQVNNPLIDDLVKEVKGIK